MPKPNRQPALEQWLRQPAPTKELSGLALRRQQQELDSLGIGEDLIIRVQLSYNGKATKHLNITKEQFDAISKIIVEEK